jgi:phosphatidylglycerophosphate synthase
MATPSPDKARLARFLFPVGLALLFVGAAVGAFVEPWWIGGLLAFAGVTDMLLALVLSRMAGGSR